LGTDRLGSHGQSLGQNLDQILRLHEGHQDFVQDFRSISSQTLFPPYRTPDHRRVEAPQRKPGA
jgi:hypothetical protein